MTSAADGERLVNAVYKTKKAGVEVSMQCYRLGDVAEEGRDEWQRGIWECWLTTS